MVRQSYKLTHIIIAFADNKIKTLTDVSNAIETSRMGDPINRTKQALFRLKKSKYSTFIEVIKDERGKDKSGKSYHKKEWRLNYESMLTYLLDTQLKDIFEETGTPSLRNRLRKSKLLQGLIKAEFERFTRVKYTNFTYTLDEIFMYIVRGVAQVEHQKQLLRQNMDSGLLKPTKKLIAYLNPPTVKFKQGFKSKEYNNHQQFQYLCYGLLFPAINMNPIEAHVATIYENPIRKLARS